MLGSLPRCSTTLFTMVETVEGVELLLGTTVELDGVIGVVVVALMATATTFFTTSSTRLLNPAVAFTTEEMTGTVVFSSTPS